MSGRYPRCFPFRTRLSIASVSAGTTVMSASGADARRDESEVEVVRRARIVEVRSEAILTAGGRDGGRIDLIAKTRSR